MKLVQLAVQVDIRWDNHRSILDVRQADDVDGHTVSWRVIKHQATNSVDLIVSGLTPVLGAAGGLSDMFAAVMTGLEELRRDMIERMDRVSKRELIEVKKSFEIS